MDFQCFKIFRKLHSKVYYRIYLVYEASLTPFEDSVSRTIIDHERVSTIGWRDGAISYFSPPAARRITLKLTYSCLYIYFLSFFRTSSSCSFTINCDAHAASIGVGIPSNQQKYMYIVIARARTWECTSRYIPVAIEDLDEDLTLVSSWSHQYIAALRYEQEKKWWGQGHCVYIWVYSRRKRELFFVGADVAWVFLFYFTLCERTSGIGNARESDPAG